MFLLQGSYKILEEVHTPKHAASDHLLIVWTDLYSHTDSKPRHAVSSECSAVLTPWTTWNQLLLGWKLSSIPNHLNKNTKNMNVVTSIKGTVNTFHCNDWEPNSVQVCLWTFALINQKATLFKVLLTRPLRNSYIYIPYCSQYIKQFDSTAK